MKTANLIAIVAIILASLSFLFAFQSSRETKALKKQLAQLSTTTSFTLQSLDSGKTVYDSAVFINDTGFFYKKGKFLGKMYSSSQEGSLFSVAKEIEALKNKEKKTAN